MNLTLRPIPLTSFLLSVKGHNFLVALTIYIRYTLVIFYSFIPHIPHSLSVKLLGNNILSKYIQNSAPSNHPTIITQVSITIILPLTNLNDLIMGLSVSVLPLPFPAYHLNSSQKIPMKKKTHQVHQLKILQWLSDLLSQNSLPFLHSTLPLSLLSLLHQILTTVVSSYSSSYLLAKQFFFFRAFAPPARRFPPQLFMYYEYLYNFHIFAQLHLLN